MAGNAVADTVANNMTTENIVAASDVAAKHATKENAEAAWDTGKEVYGFADQKCDEDGIDK